jgi:hypothetical protein
VKVERSGSYAGDERLHVLGVVVDAVAPHALGEEVGFALGEAVSACDLKHVAELVPQDGFDAIAALLVEVRRDDDEDVVAFGAGVREVSRLRKGVRVSYGKPYTKPPEDLLHVA